MKEISRTHYDNGQVNLIKCMDLEGRSILVHYQYYFDHKDSPAREVHCFNTELETHCICGPAILSYHPNGNLRREEWVQANKEHREEGPSHRAWDEDGNLIYRSWMQRGLPGRENGPVIERWYPGTGLAKSELYYSLGEWQLHRLDGPAMIKIGETGDIIQEKWYIKGLTLTRGQIQTLVQMHENTREGIWLVG